jgi:hypothetical protein
VALIGGHSGVFGGPSRYSRYRLFRAQGVGLLGIGGSLWNKCMLQIGGGVGQVGAVGWGRCWAIPCGEADGAARIRGLVKTVLPYSVVTRYMISHNI